MVSKAGVTGIYVEYMFNKAIMLLPIVLEYPTKGCNHGEGGARWRTQPKQLSETHHRPTTETLKALSGNPEADI
jgi:hypothetical protein